MGAGGRSLFRAGLTPVWFAAIVAVTLTSCGDRPSDSSQEGRAPVRIIFDTDIGSVADDLAALAMLHHLVTAGEAELLAVMSTNNERYATPAIDGLNRHFGHPDIPIGVRAEEVWEEEWHYNRVVAVMLQSELTHEDVPDATFLYRKILAAQADTSVTIVTVGPLLNLQRLMHSQPDSLSPLSGIDLLTRKIRKVVIMGGKFPEGGREANFSPNALGVTRYVLEHLTRPTVFSGFEVGLAVHTGGILNAEDPSSPLYAGFMHYSQYAPWMRDAFDGSIPDNPSFDQTAVLHAVRGGEGRWEEVKGGRVEVDENGVNRWIEGADTHQSYLRLTADPDVIAREIENLMLGRPHEGG